MKVLLYPDTNRLLGGIGTAIKNFKQAMKSANIKYTTDPSTDDFDILYIHLPDPLSLFLIKKAKMEEKKVIVHAHTTREDFVNSYRFSNSVADIVKKYLKYFYNQADLVLCPSNYTKNLLKHRYGIKNIKYISNGVDIKKFKFNKKERKKYREKYKLNGTVVFSVGHAIPRKGIFTFVRVAKKVKNVRFVWFGKVYSKLITPTNVINLIENSPENLIFTDYVDNIRAAYAAGDIFLFPSFNENQGIVVLEAAAMKRPMLLRDIPVFREWKENVHCLKAKTTSEFIKKLKILMNNEGLRKEIVRNAYKEVRLNHSIESIGKQLKEIYSEILIG